MIRDYYRLTKPGIVYGNAMTACAGFFLAANGHPKLGLFCAMLVGICLVMASACVFNNILDREIDSKMERTKKRSLVIGVILPKNATVYGAVLGIAGFLILSIFTNTLALFLAIIGYIAYLGPYAYAKRRSSWGTVVGSVSGAVPPVVGFCAFSNSFGLEAGLLFLILVLWQMPHFYAIALYRYQDYAIAGLPVFPVVKGRPKTIKQILVYVLAFSAATKKPAQAVIAFP